ncbi:hypothetical protein AB0C61_25420 [Streptomyces sp. NPDC048680]|uniref:hypothetical protein n=1 Tax=Streptomyces sp. NPDC048680 TaxID=3155492 RepID=UPI00344ABF95
MEKGMERERGAEAAPNAYERVLAEDRRVIRKSLRSSRGGAHGGLVVTAVALGAVGALGGPKWPLIIGGVCAVWCALALVVVRRRGGRGWKAIERAYIATFGWAQWL